MATTMTGWMFLLTFISILSCGLGAPERRSCFTVGGCEDGFKLTGKVVDDQYACGDFCLQQTSCAWYTFSQSTLYCQLMKTCSGINETVCPDCLTGKRDCGPSSTKCAMTGKCDSEVLSVQNYSTSDDCLLGCKSNLTCEWFTFHELSSTCEFYKDCISLTGCDHCITGNFECGPDPKDSEWHMIIGGYGSANTAELFNWKTGQQCMMPNLPVAVYGHVATFMDGVPVFCEAGPNDRKCYKLDKKTIKWVTVPSLLAGVVFGQSVYVPSKGWVVFGRLGNQLKTVQVLPSLDSEWKAGPEYPGEGFADNFCLVQVDEETTFISNRVQQSNGVEQSYNGPSYPQYPQPIFGVQQSYVVYSKPTTYGGQQSTDLLFHLLDWSNLNYRNLSFRGAPEYTYYPLEKRTTFSTCAKIYSGNSTYSIAMTSELYSTNVDFFDINGYEYKKSTKISSTPTGANVKLVSINNGSELLMYGGDYSGFGIEKQPSDSISRFSPITKRWYQFGKMLKPRAAHQVIPVNGFVCA